MRYLHKNEAPDINAVKRLIKKGADVNAKFQGEMDSLLLTCVHGHIEVAKVLLENGAIIETCDSDGRTPLIWASWNEFLPLIKLFIANGADINAKNKENETALMIASEYANTAVVEALLEAGADLTIRHSLTKNTALERAEHIYNNWSADDIDFVQKKEYKKIIQLLKDATKKQKIEKATLQIGEQTFFI